MELNHTILKYALLDLQHSLSKSVESAVVGSTLIYTQDDITITFSFVPTKFNLYNSIKYTVIRGPQELVQDEVTLDNIYLNCIYEKVNRSSVLNEYADSFIFTDFHGYGYYERLSRTSGKYLGDCSEGILEELLPEKIKELQDLLNLYMKSRG